MLVRVIIFLIINFAALGIGGLFTGKGLPSEWYTSLNKAPWTPPGWVFGAAWTLIMVCFAVYMASLWDKVSDRNVLIGLFVVQWVLNVAWNPVFFYFHLPVLGLVVILCLTLLVGYVLLNYWSLAKAGVLLIAPYFIWLLIASSLNAYIVIYNKDNSAITF